MKFPGKRKNKHYFPVTEKSRENIDENFLQNSSYHVVGIDQLLVDIECNVSDDFLKHYQLNKGQSQIIPDDIADKIYLELKKNNLITGEFAGGSVGNTLHNYCTLTEERALTLGSIQKNITVGDYAFKYICGTSSKVDLTHLQPSDKPMGRALCFVTPDGERTFGVSKGCMNDLSPEYLPEEIISRATALLLTTYVLRDENAPIFRSSLKACEIANKNNVPVILSLGTSSLVEIKRDFLLKFIKENVTVLAMNKEEAIALTNMSDPLLALENSLNYCDLSLLTVGSQGLYIGAHVDESLARATDNELHTKSLVEYNKFEFSRAMRTKDCLKPIKIYSHINPYMGGPLVIRNTNGAGDGALAALLHDMSANHYHKDKIPNSPKHVVGKFLTYSSLSQISKYANRVSFEVLIQNSPRLSKGLPEKEDSLQEAYWDA